MKSFFVFVYSRNPIPSDGEEVVKDWKTRSRGGEGKIVFLKYFLTVKNNVICVFFCCLIF